MRFLLSSICFSVIVSVLFKIWRRQGIKIEQAVLMNYPVAAALTYFLFNPDLSKTSAYVSQWWLFASLGVLFPSIFIVLGKSIAHNGIVKTDAAQRLSLVISTTAAFFLFNDNLSHAKLLGIALAFIALALLLIKSNSKQASAWQWALGVWLGYGIIDILLKELSKANIATTSKLFIIFVIATILMLAYLIFKRTKFDLPSLAYGTLLGGLNFANIYTYIRAHQILKQPALVFTVMNIGVIIFATLIGALFFKEKLNRFNLLGIIIGIVSVYIFYNAAF